MKKEDLQYIKEALDSALNDYTPSQKMAETHFNTFANAISLVDDELNLLNTDNASNSASDNLVDKNNCPYRVNGFCIS